MAEKYWIAAMTLDSGGDTRKSIVPDSRRGLRMRAFDVRRRRRDGVFRDSNDGAVSARIPDRPIGVDIDHDRPFIELPRFESNAEFRQFDGMKSRSSWPWKDQLGDRIDRPIVDELKSNRSVGISS